MSFDKDFEEIHENFYFAFMPVNREKLLVFNNKFYDLKRLIDKRPTSNNLQKRTHSEQKAAHNKSFKQLGQDEYIFQQQNKSGFSFRATQRCLSVEYVIKLCTFIRGSS